MFITTTFEDLASEVNGNFQQIDKKYPGNRGSFVHVSTYILEFNYRDINVHVKYELGSHNSGLIECKLPRQVDNCAFSIETKSQFYQLLNRRKPSLKIISKSSQLTNFIELNKGFMDLCECARRERFEPPIIGKNDADGYLLSCKFSLVFNNKELVLRPFVHFYKSLIDLFLDYRVK
ncbi:MAG: hypothetical protein QNK23_12065 [Crocinitomicaceae bacterium]|nr:hypothetical protein [Crocinitomicaceae bacterium]